jgi:hypothetical protein
VVTSDDGLPYLAEVIGQDGTSVRVAPITGPRGVRTVTSRDSTARSGRSLRGAVVSGVVPVRRATGAGRLCPAVGASSPTARA